MTVPFSAILGFCPLFFQQAVEVGWETFQAKKLFALPNHEKALWPVEVPKYLTVN